MPVLLKRLGALLAPTAAVALTYFGIRVSGSWVPVLYLHLMTVAWITFFYRMRFGSATLLPVSFLLSAAAPYLYDGAHPAVVQYAATALLVITYVLPWAVITFIAASVVVLRKHRKRER